jgi:hypothetical protein
MGNSYSNQDESINEGKVIPAEVERPTPPTSQPKDNRQ